MCAKILVAGALLWAGMECRVEAGLISVGSTADLIGALGTAGNGDTIVLAHGRYSGPIALSSGVSLDGNGSILESSSDTAPALVLRGPNVVQNLTIRPASETVPGPIGVRIITGPSTLRRVHIHGFESYGVRAGRGEGSFLEGSIESCGKDGLSASGGRWTIQSSRFTGNGDDGVDLFKANTSIVASSLFDRNADAALELAISSDVKFIYNASRGQRVTCSARLGSLPVRISNNQIGDRAFLETRSDTGGPLTDWQEFIRRTDNSNIALKVDDSETPVPTPVQLNIVQASPPAVAVSHAPAPASRDGIDAALRVRTSVVEHLPYAGLTSGDITLKGQLGSDTNISPLLRRLFDDPLEIGAWMAARSTDGDSPVSARYRQYAADLGIAGLDAADTPELSGQSPKLFAESLVRAWRPIQEMYDRTFAAMSDVERRGLQRDLEAQYGEEPELGLPLLEDYEFDIEFNDEQKRLIRRAGQIDTLALFGSANRIFLLMESLPPVLRALKSNLSAKQIAQAVIHRQATPWGPLVIAGTGADAHDSAAGFLIDLGGNDRYRALGGDSPALIVDVSGDDHYTGEIAAGIGRLSALWDGGGNDRYRSESRTQGAGLLGCGILHDDSGSDEYSANRYSQGFGLYGVGWLYDGGMEDDVYRIPGYGQGFGGVRGLGVLADAGGNDRYEILPVNNDPIRDSSRTTSMGQGIGNGIRPNGSGGLGILWDGGGRDEYLADLFAQGIGYWFGVGALVDVGAGNDNYTAYHYVQGAGIHLSVGALYDGGGADRYQAWYVAQGCGHDASIGALYDQGGNDIYSAYGLTQGAGSINGVGILADVSGRDAYMGVARVSGQGDAWYQARLREYGGVGILVDLTGDDYYATGSLNGSVWFKGDHGLGVDK